MFLHHWIGKITKPKTLQYERLWNRQGRNNRKGFQVQRDRGSQRNQDGNISLREVRNCPMSHSTDELLNLCSGSQTMAFVMALQQGWKTEDLTFQSALSRCIHIHKSIWYARIQSIMTSEVLLTLWTTVRPALSCGSGSRQNHGLTVAKFDLWVQMPSSNWPIHGCGWQCLDWLGSNSMAFVGDCGSSFSEAGASRAAPDIFEDVK